MSLFLVLQGNDFLCLSQHLSACFVFLKQLFLFILDGLKKAKKYIYFCLTSETTTDNCERK